MASRFSPAYEQSGDTSTPTFQHQTYIISEPRHQMINIFVSTKHQFLSSVQEKMLYL